MTNIPEKKIVLKWETEKSVLFTRMCYEKAGSLLA